MVDTSPGTDDSAARTPHAPVLHGDALFTTVWQGTWNESKGLLLAIERNTGETRWRLAVEGGGVKRPTLAGDVVLFTVYSVAEPGSSARFAPGASLIAADTASGEIRWKFDVESGTFNNTPALVAGDSAVFAADQGVFAVDLKTGTELWSFEGRVRTSELVADDRSVYVVTKRAARRSDSLRPLFAPAKRTALHALDLATGRERWSLRSKHNLWPVLTTGDVVHVVETSWALKALNAADGSQLWSFKLSSASHARPLVEDGMALVAALRESKVRYGRVGGAGESGALICLGFG